MNFDKGIDDTRHMLLSSKSKYQRHNKPFRTKEHDEYPMMLISSDLVLKKGNKDRHFILMEWDDKTVEQEAMKYLWKKHISGIFVSTVRGLHFLSKEACRFNSLIDLQKRAGCDPIWVDHNVERKEAVLRVSQKYVFDSLTVIPRYPLSDHELWEEYEDLVTKYALFAEKAIGKRDYKAIMEEAYDRCENHVLWDIDANYI